MTRDAPRERPGWLKALVTLAILGGAVAIMASTALYVLAARPGVPELVPGQQRPPPVQARIRL